MRYDGWLRLADRYQWSRPLIELMRSMTQREFLMRLAWMEADLDRPSRGDWYLMQIAAEIYRSYAKGEARKIKLSNMQLKRVNTDPSSETVTKQQASKIATARWFGALGIKRSK